jgi:hypothetical protein
MAALLATGVQGCLYGASLRKSDHAFRLLAYRILEQVFKDASMVPPFASQTMRSDYLPIASFILDAPA